MTNYEVKIKAERIVDGLSKNVTELYLVNAMSCTEAEARIIAFMEEEDITVQGVPSTVQVNYPDVFANGTEELFYKAKVSFVSIDEVAGKEKLVYQFMIIQAETFKKAVLELEDRFKNFTVPYDLHAVAETKIIDYLEY